MFQTSSLFIRFAANLKLDGIHLHIVSHQILLEIRAA